MPVRSDKGPGGIDGFAIDPASGALGPLPGGPIPGPGATELAAEPTGRYVYLPQQSGQRVLGFRVDSGSGTLASMGGGFPAGGSPLDVTVDPSGRFLYTANEEGTVSGLEIDPGTGDLTPVAAPFAGGPEMVNLTTDLRGRFVYASGNAEGLLFAYAIEPARGTLTPLGGSPFATGRNRPFGLATGRDFTRGDFDANGQPDLLWRNEASGENVVWLMKETALVRGELTDPAALTDVRWKVVGTPDFNGDRQTDILWRHEVTGQNMVWYMEGTKLASAAALSPPSPTPTGRRRAR